jgi:hypothetical protein
MTVREIESCATAFVWSGPCRPTVGGVGGSYARELAGGPQSYVCPMADGISGAGEPMASDTPVSETTASVVSSEGPQN